MFSQTTNFGGGRSSVAPRGEASKSKTRDYSLTGDRCSDLYNLAKRLQMKPKIDKTTEEIEYERAKEECVFAPNKNKTQF